MGHNDSERRFHGKTKMSRVLIVNRIEQFSEHTQNSLSIMTRMLPLPCGRGWRRRTSGEGSRRASRCIGSELGGEVGATPHPAGCAVHPLPQGERVHLVRLLK